MINNVVLVGHLVRDPELRYTPNNQGYENQQGQQVYVTEVVADNFQLLESRKDREAGQSQEYNQPDFSRQTPMNANPMDISDDDLPF